MVLKRKLNDMGNVRRFKARLVANGFFQKQEIDYSETPPPAVPLEVLLLLMRRLVSEGWQIHDDDISTATLNRDIDGWIYVSWNEVVYKLQKSLHDLKQSPQLWYEKWTKTLEGFSFKQHESYGCVFKIEKEKFQIAILVYDNDLVILGFTEDGVKWVKEKLRYLLNLTDPGKMSYYLGTSFNRKGNLMFLQQYAD